MAYREYNVYTDDTAKDFIENVVMSDEEARYQSRQGYIYELVNE